MDIDINKDDIHAMRATVDMILAIAKNMACAKFSGEAYLERIFFIRTVLTNVMGNFILDNTDYVIEDALNSNIEEFIGDIRNFFEKARTLDKDLHA